MQKREKSNNYTETKKVSKLKDVRCVAEFRPGPQGSPTQPTDAVQHTYTRTDAHTQIHTYTQTNEE